MPAHALREFQKRYYGAPEKVVSGVSDISVSRGGMLFSAMALISILKFS
jgi:hypothetical protein